MTNDVIVLVFCGYISEWYIFLTVPSKVKTPIHHNIEAQNNRMDQTGSLEEDIFSSSFPVHKLQSVGFGGPKRW